MRTKRENKKSGFTLVELMIVAAIIAILAAIVIPLLANNRERAIAAEGQNLLGTAASACKVYYAENGIWPADITALPQLTQDELGNAKYFGTVTWGADDTIGNYTLSVAADADAGDLSGDTITLTQAGTWGGDFVDNEVVKP